MITFVLFGLFYLFIALVINTVIAIRNYKILIESGNTHENAKKGAKDLSFFPLALFWPLTGFAYFFCGLLNKAENFLADVLDKVLEMKFNKKQ